MIAIANAFNEVSYKLSDCMCINSATTNKCIIEISRHNRNSIYTTIYKHYTLSQIHANIKLAIRMENQPALLPTNNHKMHLSIEMMTIDNNKSNYVGNVDHIPNTQIADESDIRDIFVFDNNDRRIVSIPPDEDITLFEFMDMNPSHLKPFYSIAALRMVYKIYVIDHAYLNRNIHGVLERATNLHNVSEGV